MNFLKRLWEIARNRKRFRPRSKVRAGRIAESKSARILEDQLAGTSRRVWASRRIPDHVTGRRREFDFLVAGPNTLLSIELKNWSGRIEQEGEHILQHRRRGGVVDHGPLWKTLDDRLYTLESFLQGHDIEPPPLRSLLVFANPNLVISDEVTHKRHEVVHFAKLDTGLPYDPTSPKFLAGALAQLLRDELPGDTQISEKNEEVVGVCGTIEEEMSTVERALDNVGTWDRLHLFGGQTVAGDADTVIADNHPLSDRDQWASIDSEVTRNYLAAFRSDPTIELHAHSRENGTDTTEAVEFEDTLTFRAAGDREPTAVPIRHLDHLSYGYRSDAVETMDWTELETGKRYMGRVTNIVEFGLFVDIGGPTDGLVHISNVDPGGHTDAYELPRRFDDGDVVDVRLTDIRRDDDEIDLVLVHHPKTI